MGKKATGNVSSNEYYLARMEASVNDCLSSREKASSVLGIDRTRLARIEGGSVLPHPDEIAIMAEKYNAPSLCNHYCSEVCPLGQGRIPKADSGDLDRITLQVLGALQNAGSLTDTLVSIAADGKVSPTEIEDLQHVIDLLNRICASAEALKIWAEKNIS